MNKNLSVRLTGLLLAGMILASACTQTYSQAPLATPTLIPTGLFVSPFPSGEDPLKIVADLGTQTAMAKTAEAGGTTTPGTPGTPITATATGASLTPTVGTPVTLAVTTPAPITVMPGGPTVTPRTTVVVPTVPVGRPATYTLQSGEFPYCIARRFNLNPDDLLSINGITDGGIFYPGRTLTIPQSGSWPGDRALHSHPDTYTVSSSNITIYGVACYYGDVFPEAIAQANNLPLSTTLSVGQRLTIP
ncbi:MAG: LysM peptidoglycan-binding domain-containing protein [Chloroflexi bacterium]|nr:LysM peptidoglycan-binding domain-containing protein [Chloroflexota bacterium]